MKKRKTKAERAAEERLYAFRHRANEALSSWRPTILNDGTFESVESACKLQAEIVEAMRWAQEQEKL